MTSPVDATESLAHRVLTRTADAVFVLDVATGTASHRWYDRGRSRLDLPVTSGEQQLITWVHPDDLPVVLEAYAAVVNAGDTRTTFARIHPDRRQPADSALLISIQDIHDIESDSVLVQVWLVDGDSVVSGTSTSLSSLADAAPVGLQVLNVEGRVSFENARFAKLTGDARALIDERVRAAVAGGVPVSEDLDTDDCSLRLRVIPTLDADGAHVLSVASLEDVTRVHEAEAGRAAAEEQFDALFFSSPLATALVGMDGTLVRANESFAIVTGYELNDLIGKTFQQITHPDDLSIDEHLLAEVVAGERPHYQMEKRYIHAAGHEVWVELTVAPVRGPDGAVRNFVAHVEDITTRRSMMARSGSDEDLTYWATHDHLTTLPNRRYLEEHLAAGLGRTRRASDRPIVMFLDLDDFKPVNDRLGHRAGDEVLRTIARRLRNACRDDAVVGRYGGDEFVVVARRLQTVDEVPLLADRMLASVQTPIDVAESDSPVRVGVSIGIAIAREGESAEALLARADEAAYRAKRRGKNQVSYDSA